VDASHDVHPRPSPSVFHSSTWRLNKSCWEHLKTTRRQRRSRHYTQKPQSTGRLPTPSDPRATCFVEIGRCPSLGRGLGLAWPTRSQPVERNAIRDVVKLDCKDSPTVSRTDQNLANCLRTLQIIDLDRVPEMHGHKRFTNCHRHLVYFCAPSKPLSRGSTRTEWLLQQYMPRHHLRAIRASLNAIARQLNQMPRKTPRLPHAR